MCKHTKFFDIKSDLDEVQEAFA